MIAKTQTNKIMNFHDIQSILAITGCGMIAGVLRLQIGFFTLESIRVNKWADYWFVAGVMLVAQRFIL